MTTILFVRHGETDWNRQRRLQGTRDIPLNQEGRFQAHRLAEAWTLGGDVVVSSPLRRASETAEVLSSRLAIPHGGLDPRLVERSFGQAEGLSWEERQSRFPGDVPGAEPHQSVHERARSFLEAVLSQHAGRRVVAVSHGGFINAVLALVSGGQFGTGKTSLGNASVSEIVRSEQGWRVVHAGRLLLGPSLELKA